MSSSSASKDDRRSRQPLREDVRLLGSLWGDTIDDGGRRALRHRGAFSIAFQPFIPSQAQNAKENCLIWSKASMLTAGKVIKAFLTYLT